MTPQPPKQTAIRRIIFVLAALALIIALGAGLYGIKLYLRFGPVPLCPEVPVKGSHQLTLFHPADADAGRKLGSHAGLACRESPRSYMEWYALRIHAGKIFMDVLMETRGADQDWGITGFGIWDSEKLRPVWTNFEIGEDASWAADAADVGMITSGPDGKPRRSIFRYLAAGPHAGSFEIEIHARQGKLHLYLTPMAPGALPDVVGTDRTRPGSWFQYHCVTLMGLVEGEITLYHKNKPPETFKLPVSSAEPAFAYFEHMWGQEDRTNPGKPTRYYWDWGNWGKPAERSVIFFSQVDGLAEILSIVMACVGDTCFPFLHHPPKTYARNVYSRLADVEGYLYPQELNVWAFAPGSAATVNARGFVRQSYGEWQSFDLRGRAGDRAHQINWTDPVQSVNDFYKGAQMRELVPPPVSGLTAECGATGCKVQWLAAPARKEVEYWVFRQKGGRADPGEPIAVVNIPSDGNSLQLMSLDPDGRAEYSYKVVPVRVPKTLLHDRFHAGYERTSAAAGVLPGTMIATPTQAAIMGGAGRQGLPELMPATKFSTRHGEVKPVPAREGTLEFHYLRDGSDLLLHPRFSPGTQLESYYWTITRDNVIAIAWAERVPVMGGSRMTDWEIFVSEIDLTTGSFQVFPVSMSDADDLDPQIETMYGGRMKVTWQQCRGKECRAASQEIMTVDLR